MTIDELFVESVKESHKEIYGAKVISINGKEIETILEKTNKMKSAENRANEMTNLASILHNKNSILKLFPQTENSLHFKFITLKQDTLEQNIEMLTTKEFDSIAWHKKTKNPDFRSSGIFSFQFTDKQENIMYMEITNMFSQEAIQMMKAYNISNPNWVASMLNYYPEIKAKYSKEEAPDHIPYLSEAFKNMLEKMKKETSEYLIIDLSKNGGGFSQIVIPALYMLFGDSVFSPNIEQQYVRRISALLLKKYNQTLESFNRNNNQKYKLGDYMLNNFTQTSQQSPSEKRVEYFNDLDRNNFKWKKFIADLNGQPIYTPKKIIVLTSAKTNSAAYHFLYKLYRLNDIVVVGVAPKQAGNTPMESTSFELSRTKVKGSISNAYQQLFPKSHTRARLFQPNFPLKWEDYRKADFIQHSELFITLQLIKKGEIR